MGEGRLEVLGRVFFFGQLLLEETAQVVDVGHVLEFVVEAVEAAPLESFLGGEGGLELELLGRLEVGVGVLGVLLVLLDLFAALLLV